MKLQILIITILFLSVLTSTAQFNSKQLEIWKQEIMEVEKKFSQMAQEKGLQEAFVEFAADSAVLSRANKLFIGKDEISHVYSDEKYKNAKLVWHPDFIDVAKSGDLAYTFGKFTYSYPDSTGKQVNLSGYFHTVWKRQPNGEWKYVWD